jgi:hypothetical protein
MADIKLRQLGEDSIIKVKVVITKEFKLRLWIALKLIALASFVLGCGIEVNQSDISE